MPKQFHKGLIEVGGSRPITKDEHFRRASDVDTSKRYRNSQHFRYHRRTTKEVKEVIEKFKQSNKIPNLLRDKRILQRRSLIP